MKRYVAINVIRYQFVVVCKQVKIFITSKQDKVPLCNKGVYSTGFSSVVQDYATLRRVY